MAVHIACNDIAWMHDNVTGIVTTIVSEYTFMYEQGFSINL